EQLGATTPPVPSTSAVEVPAPPEPAMVAPPAPPPPQQPMIAPPRPEKAMVAAAAPPPPEQATVAPTAPKQAMVPGPSIALTPITEQDQRDLSLSVTPHGGFQILPGRTTSTGKQLFHFTVWVEVEESFAKSVKSVSYHFNHSSFSNAAYVSNKAPTFATSYD